MRDAPLKREPKTTTNSRCEKVVYDRSVCSGDGKNVSIPHITTSIRTARADKDLSKEGSRSVMRMNQEQPGPAAKISLAPHEIAQQSWDKVS